MLLSVEIMYAIVQLMLPVTGILIKNVRYKMVCYCQDLFLFRIAEGVFTPGLPVKSGLAPTTFMANAFAKGFWQLSQFCVRVQ